MIQEILLSFAIQVVTTIGVIILFGWLISLCNKQFYRNFGRYGRAVCYMTGFIGTPVHELSHALFCVIFGHRITDIKLFNIGNDGTLGYVNHSYNKKNIYQLAGNFFIGVAPIIVISALLYGLAYLLIPDFVAQTDVTASAGFENFNDWAAYIWQVIKHFFCAAATWQWWVFLITGMFLALHMTLSGADIRSAASGLSIVLILLLTADFITAFASMEALRAFTSWMTGAGSIMLCFLLLSLIISLLATALSFVFRLLRR